MGTTAAVSAAAGLSAVKAVFDVSKSISELLKQPKVDAAEVVKQLNLVLQYAADAQRSLYEAEKAIAELERRLEDRARTEEMGKGFTSEVGVYWLDNFPYCPVCWDADRKPVRLAGPQSSIEMGMQLWDCPVHSKVHYPISRSFFMNKPRTA